MMHRRARLEAWLKQVLEKEQVDLEPACADASFRSYWRVRHLGRSYVAMDAPPDKEDAARFVRIGEALRSVGLHAPELIHQSPALGFLLLEDLGKRHYLDVLDAENVDRLYGDALGALAALQACAPVEGLPEYDGPFFRREMDLFTEWLLDKQLGICLTGDERVSLERAWGVLIDSALQQPRVFVHRDFHSRNLLLTGPPSPGILDFQDAVVGPVTYDLVSLLRDCYIAWPRERVETWAWGYFALAVQSGILRPEHEADFLRWFDLMGVQRHLKASGIFARLKVRDGKPGYQDDIPRTLGYILEIAPAYPELHRLAALIGDRVMPALGRAENGGP
jgi:aminoglycoside/choline kinase family phosphotransferase